ncbi:hypothetical protein Rhopal_006079-T1 [Rhodotorula paludigena]|uniref:RING-type domain-containing protein n=1 Tax=Rhodotorula paludigena TaxID=86838 RepID=A0AAV5GUY8_9BASI|nr:hypothetical protein Rhopal_006079-T1 [Rhodotorula paludigena]
MAPFTRQGSRAGGGAARSSHRRKGAVHASPAPAPPASLAPTALGSSSPIPTSLDAASAGAQVKPLGDVSNSPDPAASPTERAVDEARRSRTRKRAERDKVYRSESEADVFEQTLPDSTTARRATFSQVTSSSRASLAGLGQAQATPMATPPRSSPYVPPHIRRLESKLANKENDPLARFDRSACPEPEDSFYSHVSSSLSFDSPTHSRFSTPNTSFALSPPTASRSHNIKALHLSPAPGHLFSPSSLTSPTTLISRQPYLDPSNHPHPTPILEEFEVDDSFLAPAPPGSARSWADEVEDALTANEEAFLGSSDYHGDCTSSGGDIQVQIGVELRRESVFTAGSSGPGLPEDAVKGDGKECTGCGAAKTDCFVVLDPCGHLLCPVCLNSLINAAAHRPPRPLTCYACAALVVSFKPAEPSIGQARGGVGLVAALRQSLHKGEVERRHASPEQSTDLDAHVGDGIEARRGRRRSSVVAAAIATVLSTPSVTAKTAPVSPQTPKESRVSSSGSPLPGEPYSHRRGRRSSTIGSLVSLESASSADERHDSSLQGSAPCFESVAARRPRISSVSSLALTDYPDGALGPSRAAAPDLFGHPQHSVQQRHLPSALTEAPQPGKQADPIKAVDWPVVRLDNVPWEVTVDQIEAWLPHGTLASDLGNAGSALAAEGDEALAANAGVTMAVHILCNRTDGRTLNQAYIECSSRSAARKIVRLRDGVKLCNRPVHVSIASQSELLETVFPSYRPGFTGVEPNAPLRKNAVPVPLLVQTELTGLLNLCRLETPWAFPRFYNSTVIVRLFTTACAAIEILGTVKHRVNEWQDILTLLVDAILRCPVFWPQQKQKAVRIAASVGFSRSPADSNDKKASLSSPHCSPLQAFDLARSVQVLAPPATPLRFGIPGVFDHLNTILPFDATSSGEAGKSVSSPDADPSVPSPISSDDPGPRDEPSSRVSPYYLGESQQKQHRRRRSSLAAQLGIEPALLDAVAAALGISLSAHDETAAPKGDIIAEQVS